MNANTKCESCSMPIESGPYCSYCTNPSGTLIGFEECVERFGQWTRRHEPHLADAEVRRRTLEFMATMPAWKNHPEVRSRGKGA